MGLSIGSHYVVDAQLGYQWPRVGLSLAVENLFDTPWWDSVFAYPSRPEQNGQVVNGVHVTPGTPTSASLRLEARF
jgi:outer membrane receptor protein involved in Fe transport